MKRSAEAEMLAVQVLSRLDALPVANTPALRGVRREFSQKIEALPPAVVLETAQLLLTERFGAPYFIAYELVRYHKPSFENLSRKDLQRLGATISSWSTVDSFATILSGPSWLACRIPDSVVLAWAHSRNLWWRRASLVSTVALSRRGKPDDCRKTIAICGLFVSEREDLLVKALSWALRELSKKQSDAVRSFLKRHQQTLAARVLRETEHKLDTGLKAPRR